MLGTFCETQVVNLKRWNGTERLREELRFWLREKSYRIITREPLWTDHWCGKKNLETENEAFTVGVKFDKDFRDS